jgi:hypothetical protein
MYQNKNVKISKIDNKLHERILKEFCPNASLDDMMTED